MSQKSLESLSLFSDSDSNSPKNDDENLEAEKSEKSEAEEGLKEKEEMKKSYVSENVRSSCAAFLIVTPLPEKVRWLLGLCQTLRGIFFE